MTLDAPLGRPYTRSMTRGYQLATALVLGAATLSLSVSLTAQDRQRGMYVSIVDNKGVPVENIGPNDVLIREDGTAREVLRVQPATDPIDIALLVDTSTAARTFVSDYRLAIPAFLDVVLGEESGGQNHVAIIGIGERPTIFTDYTSDRKRLEAGLGRVFAQPDAGTYLLDAIREVGQGLEKKKSSRAVMVALLSEGPELSSLNWQTVLDRLKSSGATFHALAIGSPANFEQDRSMVLSMGTKNSGGRSETVLIPSALTSRLKQVAREIVGQYRVTYARPDSLIPPEKIQVTARREGLTARGIPIPTTPDRPAQRER